MEAMQRSIVKKDYRNAEEYIPSIKKALVLVSQTDLMKHTELDTIFSRLKREFQKGNNESN